MRNSSQIENAVKLLDNDELVVIPTETVYGLAANAYSEKAIEKIFRTKNRPSNNPLIVHLVSAEELHTVSKNIPTNAYKLADYFWPGPLTMILEKADHLSPKITAGKETVAVRVPNHQTTLSLLKALDYPLVAPSANRSNHISPTTAEHVKISLGSNTPFILDGGPCARGIESTIVGFDNNAVKIYRLGAIEPEEIEKALGCKVQLANHTSEETIAPGMFTKHYSPGTPFVSAYEIESEIRKNVGKKMGVICFSSPPSLIPEGCVLRKLTSDGDIKDAAANLYQVMHELDLMSLDLIIAELVPYIGVGASVNDRLLRASSK